MYHLFILLGLPFFAFIVATLTRGPEAERKAKAGELFVEHGDVVASQVWSETRVTSNGTSGGGGYVHPIYGGHVSSPNVSVSSRTQTIQRFFVKVAGQLEEQFTVSGEDTFPVREGHHILLVSDAKNYLALNNTATGHNYFFDGSLKKYVSGLHIGGVEIAVLLLSAIVACILEVRANPTAEEAVFIIEASVGFLIAVWLRRSIVRRSATGALKSVILDRLKGAAPAV